MKRAPSKESEEEEILSLGEGRRLRGEAPGKSGVWGVAFSGPSVGPEPLSTALPQEGQKRAVPAISLPQVGQRMIVAGVYHRLLPGSDCVKQSLLRKRFARLTTRFGRMVGPSELIVRPCS